MHENKKKTLIFDFDGTLADTIGLFIDIAKKLVLKLDMKVPENTFSRESIKKYRNLTLKQLQSEFNIGPFLALKLLTEGRKEYSRGVKSIKLFENIKSTLKELDNMGFELGILSSANAGNIRSVLKKEDLEIFAFVYQSKKLFGKATWLKRIMKREGLEIENVIYIGDEIRDVHAAQKAGVESGTVTWGFNSQELLSSANPDHIWGKPEEILAFFDKK